MVSGIVTAIEGEHVIAGTVTQNIVDGHALVLQVALLRGMMTIGHRVTTDRRDTHDRETAGHPRL